MVTGSVKRELPSTHIFTSLAALSMGSHSVCFLALSNVMVADLSFTSSENPLPYATDKPVNNINNEV
jgi:hypothetical protein